MSTSSTDVVAGNYFDKYRSKNPVYQRMVGGFLDAAKELLQLSSPTSVLEVGAGPGDLADRLGLVESHKSKPEATYIGTDISEQQVAFARSRYPDAAFQVASVYELPFSDESFDLCLACEVFEHLEDPAAALAEVWRVTRSHALVSVPWEPLWRILNVVRGKYVIHCGNTPGHLQHFSRRAIKQLVATKFDIVVEKRPIPWTMVLAEKRLSQTYA